MGGNSLKEISEELKPYFNPNSETEQLNRLNQLTPYLAEYGRELISSTYCRGDECKINKLNDITANDRSSLFSALFPGIAAEVECTYENFNLLTKLPWERSPGEAGAEYKTTHIAQNTVWLMRFASSIQGFEDQNIFWFLDYEDHFHYLGHLFAALITKQDNQGKEVLAKVLSIPQPNKNVLVTFLCVPLDIGEPYLEVTLNSLIEKGVSYSTYGLPVHPLTIGYAYEFVLGKNNNLLLDDLAKSIHRNRCLSQRCDHEMIESSTKTIIEYIREPEKVSLAIETGNHEEIYYALLAIALQDQKLAVQYIAQVLKSGKPENVKSACEVLICLNTKEVIPLILDCVSAANTDILQKLFSHRFCNDHDPCNYFDRYLNCYQDQLAQSNLFESMEKIQNENPGIIEKPNHEFIKYLGERSIRRLEFLRKMNRTDLYELVCNLTNRINKDQETIDYLIYAASRKIKRNLLNDKSLVHL